MSPNNFVPTSNSRKELGNNAGKGSFILIPGTTTISIPRSPNEAGPLTNKKFSSRITKSTAISGPLSRNISQEGTFKLTQNWQHHQESLLLDHQTQPSQNEQIDRGEEQHQTNEVHQAIDTFENLCYQHETIHQLRNWRLKEKMLRQFCVQGVGRIY